MEKLQEQLHQMNEESGTALSLYLSTPRDVSDPNSHAIRFKNLLSEAEDLMAEQMDKNDVDKYMESLQEIQKDIYFWNTRSEAFALFLRNEDLLIYNLSADVEDKVVVQDILHLIPLLAAEQQLSAHYILDLSRDRFKIYHGDGAGLTEVEDHNVLSFNELYDDLDADSNVNVGSYGGKQASYHGHRSTSDMREKDKEKYYRYLDKELTPYFVEKGLPVILAGVRENIADWRQCSDNKIYLEKTLNKPMTDFSNEELKNTISEIFHELEMKKIDQAMSSLNKALADDKASTNDEDIEKALEMAKVETLYIRSDYPEDSRKTYDHFVRDCLIQGGNVVIIPVTVREMEKTIAALYRY